MNLLGYDHRSLSQCEKFNTILNIVNIGERTIMTMLSTRIYYKQWYLSKFLGD